MSMTSVNLMVENARKEEAAVDAREQKRAAKRKVVLSEEEVKVQGEELYASAVRHITKDLTAGGKKSEISCRLRPNCVFDYVVTNLLSNGWKAKHSYNDGYNTYDFIIVEPPNTLESMLKTLTD
jgi:hypothetical protein